MKLRVGVPVPPSYSVTEAGGQPFLLWISPTPNPRLILGDSVMFQKWIQFVYVRMMYVCAPNAHVEVSGQLCGVGFESQVARAPGYSPASVKKCVCMGGWAGLPYYGVTTSVDGYNHKTLMTTSHGGGVYTHKAPASRPRRGLLLLSEGEGETEVLFGRGVWWVGTGSCHCIPTWDSLRHTSPSNSQFGIPVEIDLTGKLTYTMARGGSWGQSLLFLPRCF